MRASAEAVETIHKKHRWEQAIKEYLSVYNRLAVV